MSDTLPFERVDTPPGVGRSAERATVYAPLVRAANAAPGEWFKLPCGDRNKAYSRATVLRKTYGLRALARDGDVFVCYEPDNGNASGADDGNASEADDALAEIAGNVAS
jgi:hypothetical protein